MYLVLALLKVAPVNFTLNEYMIYDKIRYRTDRRAGESRNAAY